MKKTKTVKEWKKEQEAPMYPTDEPGVEDGPVADPNYEYCPADEGEGCESEHITTDESREESISFKLTQQ